MSSDPANDLPRRFRRLLAAVRRDPERHGGGTVGDFGAFLGDLYWVCAEVSGLAGARDEAIARCLASRRLFGSEFLVAESERLRPFAITEPAVERLLAFWDDVDGTLGLFREPCA